MKYYPDKAKVTYEFKYGKEVKEFRYLTICSFLLGIWLAMLAIKSTCQSICRHKLYFSIYVQIYKFKNLQIFMTCRSCINFNTYLVLQDLKGIITFFYYQINTLYINQIMKIITLYFMQLLLIIPFYRSKV